MLPVLYYPVNVRSRTQIHPGIGLILSHQTVILRYLLQLQPLVYQCSGSIHHIVTNSIKIEITYETNPDAYPPVEILDVPPSPNVDAPFATDDKIVTDVYTVEWFVEVFGLDVSQRGTAVVSGVAA